MAIRLELPSRVMMTIKKMEISSVKAKEKLVRYRTTTLAKVMRRQQAEDDACQVLFNAEWNPGLGPIDARRGFTFHGLFSLTSGGKPSFLWCGIE